MKNSLPVIVGCLSILFSCNTGSHNPVHDRDYKDGDVVIEAELTDAPSVPTPIVRNYPAKVIVRLEITEAEKRLSDGVTYTFWTFGGSVPGKFIRVREGDQVEVHLRNNETSKNPHNIDLHAVTGPGGGATSSFTAPGHETVFSFMALNPGLYVYHCATAPVGMHIANGMYGLILVEPKEGLPYADKEYYVMQGEFYTKGGYGDPGHQTFDMNKALEENPDYVVFNGNVGALSGDNAIQASIGERVRIYIGNGGPSLISSFHVIGEIFDKVYLEGGTHVVQKNVQTTLVPSGGASIVEMKMETSGSFLLVDHSIFRAFNKGALGMLKVDGDGNKSVYSGQIYEGVYLPEGSTLQEMPEAKAPAAEKVQTKESRIALGKNIFSQNCQACHQANGEGVPHAFPPLAKSDYLNGDVSKGISAIVHGLEGPIVVNGKSFNSLMPKLNLSDDEVASVLTYVLNNWGNNGSEVTPGDVAKVRSAGPKH